MILDAAKSGILSVPNVPEVILLAAKSGILPVPNVPEVILLDAKLGTLSALNVPESILDAAIEPLNDPAVNSLVLGLYFNCPSDFTALFPLEESTNVTNLAASALLSSLTETWDAEPADISPTLIQSTCDPVDERTCPEVPVLESLSVILPEIVNPVIEILGVPVNPCALVATVAEEALPDKAPLKVVELRVPLLGLYLRLSFALTALLPLFAEVKFTNWLASVELSLIATWDAEPAERSPMLIQSTCDPVEDNTWPEVPVLESLSVMPPEIVKPVIEILGVPVNPCALVATVAEEALPLKAPLNVVAVKAPVLGLYLRLSFALIPLLPLFAEVKFINWLASAELSVIATCDAEPADISPTLIQSTWLPVEDRTCPDEPVLESLSVILPLTLISWTHKLSHSAPLAPKEWDWVVFGIRAESISPLKVIVLSALVPKSTSPCNAELPVTLRVSLSSSPLTSTPVSVVANLYVALPSKYNSTALLSLITTPFSPVTACSSRLPATDLILPSILRWLLIVIDGTERTFVLGLYVKSVSTLIGLLPLFAPRNEINWDASVEFKFVPTLLALATLVVLAFIQFIPEPVEASIWPESPRSPVASWRPDFTWTLAANVDVPLKVDIPDIWKSELAATPNWS